MLNDASNDTPVHVSELAAHNGWRPEAIGASVNGVPIIAWWPGTATPTRVVWAAIHGEEWVTSAMAHTVLRTTPARAACAVVVPIANPDGVLGATRQNARGVDLNRNFPSAAWTRGISPTFWPTTMTRTTEHRTQWSSTGPHPASEPEVQALCSLVDRVQPEAVIDIHTPLDCVIAISDRSLPLAHHLAAPAGLRVRRMLDTPTPGDSAAWCEQQGAAAVTYEMEMAPVPELWHRHSTALTSMVVDRLLPVGGELLEHHNDTRGV